MRKKYSDRFRPGLLRFSIVPLLSVVLLYGTACSPTTKGAVKDDVSITQQTAKLEEAGVNYNGPQYNVAIMTFENQQFRNNIRGGNKDKADKRFLRQPIIAEH